MEEEEEVGEDQKGGEEAEGDEEERPGNNLKLPKIQVTPFDL